MKFRTARAGDGFEAVDSDPRNELLVAEREGEVIACLQVTYVPGRGAGAGRALLEWTTERARARGCTLVQLMSNRRRERTHEFYASLGFEQSHKGFKRAL